MNADSAFLIGTTHAVCQDYSIAINTASSSYVIVSDGCSTSPHTDIGARLLVQAAVQIIRRSGKEILASLSEEASRLALEWAHCLGLTSQSVDATLLAAYSDGDDLIISATGDGVIVLEPKEGPTEVYSIAFPSGFPLYPAYIHQSERLGAWRANKQAYKEVRRFKGSLSEPVESRQSTCASETFRFKANDFKRVTLISDGVHSFYKTQQSHTSKQLSPVPLDQILEDLISFKGGTGSFVARRLQKLKRTLFAKNTHHLDDLSVATLYLG